MTFSKICVAASLETLCEDPTIRTLQSLRQRVVWKLLIEISRTAPAAFLQLHLVPHFFSFLQLHLTSSMHALEAIGWVVQIGAHSLPFSNYSHPQDSGVGLFCRIL